MHELLMNFVIRKNKLFYKIYSILFNYNYYLIIIIII